MKIQLVLLCLVLLLSSLLATTYTVEVSNEGEAEITMPLMAKLGYETLPVVLTAGSVEDLPSFILINNFPLNSIVSISSVVIPNIGLVIENHDDFLLPADGMDHTVNVTYIAQQPGNYTVTYHVIADMHTFNSNAQAVTTICVPVRVDPHLQVAIRH